MSFDEFLAERVRVSLARRKAIEEKKMFGCLAFLLKGKLLVAVRNNSLLVRLGPVEGEAALLEPHVTPFKINGRGSIHGWILISNEGLQTDDQLTAWIQQAVNFVRTLKS